MPKEPRATMSTPSRSISASSTFPVASTNRASAGCTRICSRTPSKWWLRQPPSQRAADRASWGSPKHDPNLSRAAPETTERRHLLDGEAVLLAGERPEVHGAEAQAAHPEPGAAETDVLHATSITPHGTSEHRPQRSFAVAVQLALAGARLMQARKPAAAGGDRRMDRVRSRARHACGCANRVAALRLLWRAPVQRPHRPPRLRLNLLDFLRT